MSQLVLPHTNETGPNEWGDVYDNDKAIQDTINGGLENDNLSGSADISRANLAVESKPVKWYEPAIITAAQVRTNAAFGLLDTPDVIEDVVIPEGALVVVRYAALIRESSGNGEMHAAIFVGATQLRTCTNTGDEVSTGQESPWQAMTTNGRTDTDAGGLTIVGNNGSEEMPAVGIIGTTELFATAGTFDIAVKYRSSGGGTAAVKQRRLYVGVVGAKA